MVADEAESDDDEQEAVNRFILEVETRENWRGKTDLSGDE